LFLISFGTPIFITQISYGSWQSNASVPSHRVQDDVVLAASVD
jgi:hypothetical protein